MRIPHRLAAQVWFVAVFAAGLLGASPAEGQVVDPTTAEFDPSTHHDIILDDGRAAVTRYDLEFYNAGATSPFQVMSLGKPTPQTDGKIRITLTNVLAARPSPGLTYLATVAAVGPGGIGRSAPSNPFSFSPCSYQVTPASIAMPATGGSAAVAVTAASGCPWTVVSDATWLSITAGASGSGDGLISIVASPSMAAGARTATLIIAGQTIAVNQDGLVPAAPTNLRIITAQ
jgi:hypothetical protein